MQINFKANLFFCYSTNLYKAQHIFGFLGKGFLGLRSQQGKYEILGFSELGLTRMEMFQPSAKLYGTISKC